MTAERLMLVTAAATAVPMLGRIWEVRHRRSIGVVRSPDRVRALVFTSRTCAGCTTQRALLEHLGPDEAGLVEYVDVEEQPELAERYGILGLPTSVFIGTDGTVERIRYGIVDTASFRKMLVGRW